MAPKGFLVVGLAASLAAAGPCDIYKSGGTPCVAAHSTTRALYDAYTGALYEVSKGYGGATTKIYPIKAGGVANVSAQTEFCTSSCLISTIYDQSGNGNDLTEAPAGGEAKGPQANGADNLSPATGAPATLGGSRVYGVYIQPQGGYRKMKGNGVATGDSPEGIYAVLDGTHYNGQCCFDYGNAETNAQAGANGAMEALYFGNCGYWGKGSGSGPWIMADLEDGVFAGGSKSVISSNPSINYRFVHGIVKGNSGNSWAIRGGNAQSGSLSTFYSGARPSGYSPMRKQGGIILGIGGDNSDSAEGTFYEGAITSGYPSDATEDSVHSNIVAAGYAA